jgi:hypothetical protein
MLIIFLVRRVDHEVVSRGFVNTTRCEPIVKNLTSFSYPNNSTTRLAAAAAGPEDPILSATSPAVAGTFIRPSTPKNCSGPSLATSRGEAAEWGRKTCSSTSALLWNIR